MLFVLGLAVMAAIDLDDEALLETDEVDDLGPDRMLSAEATCAEPTTAQLRPQNAFRVGHLFAELARQLVRHGTSLARRQPQITPTKNVIGFSPPTAFVALSSPGGLNP